MISLRDYQQALIEKVHGSMVDGNRRVVMQLPTAGGKTRICSEVIRRSVHRGNVCIFLADRRKLIDQAAEEFRSHDLDVGIVMAGRAPDLDAPVQVAT
ncbi:MAG: DEAD/DEAH box helicase family protein, partial [Actinobacteria bacterium]|nr:DEAD/DEAH box helicase family protein [Actinomycetota bacterium]